MRRPERIPIIADLFFDNPIMLNKFVGYKCTKLYDYWKVIIRAWESEPDLRFGQFLVNMWLIPHMSQCWHIEEDNWLIENEYLNIEDIKFWGRNYDENKQQLTQTEYVLLKDLSTEHIEAIIEHFGGRKEAENRVNPLYYKYFLSRLESFGKNLEYKKGDIVVWRGGNPAILVIARDFKVDNSSHLLECAVSKDKKYNSLHYSNLRPANEEERILLGKKTILKL